MSSKLSSLETTITLCLSLMIIVTIIGNILVCLSVVLVRKLRSPSNYLLVSLAISDLCVAILVMPLALNLEVKGYWDLGPTLCDMWVSFDVTSCTASILNLCMISVDRYLTITKPLTYGVKRTTKRMTAFIAIVWVSSCLISVPPLLVLGNEHGPDDKPTCQVSQQIVYQLYATLGAFYIPLGVMIILYYKIYGAAKSVVDAELRSLGHTTDRLVNNNNNNNNINLNSTSSHSHSTNMMYHQQQQQQQQHQPHSRYFPVIKPLLKSTITTCNKQQYDKPSSASVNYDFHQQSESTLSDSECQHGNKIDHSLIYHQQQQTRDSGAECFNEIDKSSTITTKSSPTLTVATTTTTPPPPPPPTTTLPTPRNGLINCKDTITINETTISDTAPKLSSYHNNNNNNNNSISNNNNNNNSFNVNNNNNSTNSDNNFHSSLLSSYKRVKESMLSSTKSHHRSTLSTSSPPTPTQNKYHSCIIQSHGSPINCNNSSCMSTTNSNTFCSTFGGVRKSLGDRLSFHAALSSGTDKRRTSSMLKERKASITLGVIMTAFTACWLPFFILALLRPFSETVNAIPHWISSLCYWLGLTNSMLNPIIYVTFHHDFRKAFRYLLCLQCSTMDFRLRERAYQSQYGINNSSDNHLHHLPHHQVHHQFQQNQYYTHNHHHSSSSSPSPFQPSPLPIPSSSPNQLTSCQPVSQSNQMVGGGGGVGTVISCNLNRSGSNDETRKTLALKENLIPANYHSSSSSPSSPLLPHNQQQSSSLQPLTSNIDDRFTSQQEHLLLSKHTPL
ncbi:octopamine receptor-like [Panonychus citri]|uniref:octopamine receptor-like n=1 Tax=Panonychus citri TaxID=50023 RepID=UPI0023073054|nr:octopamine receptor-like [Panonychus citri]XP_053206861.1 octopamine receptor-like [Panonychus citri]XP_053206862.1 octopamine receptor-like [Panonychus citri]XP_053206863.1 octopamine receptor-like [Panonychus citri]XP_053206864.1 octopamine receptor-like [Panonychus citri]